jgi:DNA-binding winged helix-turn-helix (wHTH) protein/Tol biopolymer transport system component
MLESIALLKSTEERGRTTSVDAPIPAGSSRGATSSAPRIYVFGEFRLDAEARVLRHEQRAVQLPSRAFDALVYLIAHRDRLVGKNELVEAVWHDVVVTDDSLIHAVSVLRRALADDANQPRYIRTMPRRGYRFVAPVREIVAAPSVAAIAAPSGASAGAVASARRALETLRRPRTFLRREAARVAAAFALAGTAAVAVWALSFLAVLRPEPPVHDPGRAVLLYQPPPPGATIVSGGVLSPDGLLLAFIARDEASNQASIWLRALRSSELRPLEHTEGASKPFWSPDSRRIGFFANGVLMTVDTNDGDVRTVAAAGGVTAAGGTWGPDNTILYAEWDKGLFSVHASGGEPAAVAALDRSARDIALSWPQFLPDGRHFLYQIVSLDPARTGTYIGDLDTRQSFRVLEGEAPAAFAPPGHLLHVQRNLLIAEEFDVRSLKLTGRALVLARGISPPSLADENLISGVGDVIAYRQGIRQQQLAWLDRAGRVLGTVPMPDVMFNPRLSPDGSHLVATSSVTTNPGLWLASLSREQFERLETDAIAPLWSPDGMRIAFTARGGLDLLVRSPAGGVSRRLVSGGAIKILNDWAPDGEHIVYTQVGDGTQLDLWGIRVEDGAEFPILATPFNEMQARVSPDGHWIAYVSDDAGPLEVYVQRYPELGERYQVSVGGGGQPQWRHDQGEIFYIAADRSLVAVPVQQGERLVLGTPRRLFRAPLLGGPDNARDYYAANGDGRRFLVDGAIGDGKDSAITVVVNWAAPADGPAESRARLD